MKGAPMQGTFGRKVMVKVNHYEVQSLPIVKIFEYTVSLMITIEAT